MKRSFTGPVWLLLIFGLSQAVAEWQLLRLVLSPYLPAGDSSWMGAAAMVSILMWPLILWVEALVYWLIRRRNGAQLLSWTHAAIFCLAFLISGFVYMLRILHSPLAGGMNARGGRNVMAGTFWALVILAHAAFVQVLILAFRKPKPVVKEGDDGTENILDDVLL